MYSGGIGSSFSLHRPENQRKVEREKKKDDAQKESEMRIPCARELPGSSSL